MKLKLACILAATGLLASCGANWSGPTRNNVSNHNINNVSGINPTKGNPAFL